MERRDRLLEPTLRAFLAQSRCGQVDGQQWEELAQKFLHEWTKQQPRIIDSAFSALQNSRSSVSEGRWEQFYETLKKHEHCNADSESGLALCRAMQLLNQHDDPASVRKRGMPDLISEFSHGNGSGPSKRQRANNTNADENGNGNADDDNDVQFIDTASNISSRRRLYGFHLLKTHGIPCHGDAYIELTDILAAGAELAVIFNYQFDIDWMLDEMPALQTCQKVMIVHGMSPTDGAVWKAMFENYGMGERVKVVRPETPSYGTVHSKMFLLFYSTGCRVCIHTSNMVASDWKMKTQGAYMRDFPLRRDDAGDGVRVECDFGRELREYVMRSIRIEERDEIISRILRHDFSSAGVAIVSSVPGKHGGDNFSKFGHMRLRHLLSSETFDHGAGDSAVICQFSSLGSLRPEWVAGEFGQSVSTQFESTGKESTKMQTVELQFVYPTEAQVVESNEGILAGASIPVTSKNLHREHVLTRLHRWNCEKSGRERSMPHIKTLVRYGRSEPDRPAWVFLGSFNLSVAAWGRITGGMSCRRAKTRPPQSLYILSYEIGVLFTRQLCAAPTFALPDACVKYNVMTEREDAAWMEARRKRGVDLVVDSFEESQTAANLQVMLPIPYALPPKKYSSGDSGWTIN